MARLRAMASELAKAYFHTPETRVKWLQSRGEVGRKLTERRIGWCPPEYREQYLRLMRNGHKNAAIARREITAIIEQDAARKAEAQQARLAEMTPFERQMEAVRNGARLVEKVQMPSRRYDYTLGGVSA
jgi:hypothetical protein